MPEIGVIGGGIVGVAIARALALQNGMTVTLLEKEARLAVLAARGIGAENALGRFTGPHLDLDGLEHFLSSHPPVGRGATNARRLEAILYFDPRHNGSVGASVVGETGSDMAFVSDVLREVVSP